MAVGFAALLLAVTPVSLAGWRGLQRALGSASDWLSLVPFAFAGVAAVVRLVRRAAPHLMILWLAGWCAIGLWLRWGIAFEAERLHVVQYALVGFVSVWAMPRAWCARRRWLLAACCTLMLGALEELIQSWLPGRLGQWRDVLLDGVGGLAGSSLHVFLCPSVSICRLPLRSSALTARGRG